MKEFLRKLPRFLPTVLVVGAVLYLTLVPKPLPDTDINWMEHTDKVVHALMMLGVYLTVAFDIMRRGRQPVGLSSSCMVWLLVAVVAFGGAIELAQGAMGAGRGCDLYDFIADAIGAYVGYLIARRYSGSFAGWLAC